VSDAAPQHPTFAEAFRFWLKLGFISFGGPTGQIAIMHSELVEKRKWVSEARFLHALNYCMLLPGPEATQLATYIGWLLHRTWGGVVAGALFVLPSMVILWVLSWIYVTFGEVPWVAGIFYGLKPAVLGIVAAAVLRIGQRALKNEIMWTLAGLAFVAIYFFKAPFPAIVFGTALLGWLGGKCWPARFAADTKSALDTSAPVIRDDVETAPFMRPSWRRTLRVTVTCLLLWWTPVFAAGWLLGWHHAISREGIFFSKAAMVTFGGAYAVLPYVSQQAVENYGWLDAPQMLDGLGLAETTPGPLIMVLQFVGYLGGWNHPGSLPPLLAATLGAGITTWTTFVPCFLWILVGAPYLEKWRGQRALNSALNAVTAAVVGVILNLAVWFGQHVVFPEVPRVDAFALIVSIIAFAGLWRFKWNIVPVILGAGAAGVIRQTVF
jgi:chromate transporter